MKTETLLLVACIILAVVNIGLLLNNHFYRFRDKEQKGLIAQLMKYDKQMKQHTSLPHVLDQHKIIKRQDLNVEVRYHKCQLESMTPEELKERVKQETAFEIGNAICNQYDLKFTEEVGIQKNEGLIRYRTKITIIEP